MARTRGIPVATVARQKWFSAAFRGLDLFVRKAKLRPIPRLVRGKDNTRAIGKRQVAAAFSGGGKGGRAKDGLSAYLHIARSVPHLSAREEKELIMRYRGGDRTARDKVICANLWWVPFVARRLHQYGPRAEDAIAEGNLGLFRALERFDVDKGLRFSTYAKWWVFNAMTAALNSPRSDKGRVTPATDTNDEERGAHINGQHAWDSYGRSNSGSDQNASDHRESAGTPLPAGWNGDSDIAYEVDLAAQPEPEDDAPQPDEAVSLKEALKLTREAIAQLPQRERLVVEHRYGLNGKPAKTLEEVGESLGCSAERVRQIQQSAIDILRRALF